MMPTPWSPAVRPECPAWGLHTGSRDKTGKMLGKGPATRSKHLTACGSAQQGMATAGCTGATMAVRTRREGCMCALSTHLRQGREARQPSTTIEATRCGRSAHKRRAGGQQATNIRGKLGWEGVHVRRGMRAASVPGVRSSERFYATDGRLCRAQVAHKLPRLRQASPAFHVRSACVGTVGHAMEHPPPLCRIMIAAIGRWS